jgi:serine/threonine-protein phosphatase PGAM5
VALAAAQPPTVPSAVPPAQPTPKPKTVYLMRHGHYAPDDKADPILGPGLTPIGVAQARLAAARLAALPQPFEAVLASPIARARETARVVADDLRRPFEVVEALAECTPPTWRAAVVADEKPESMAACAKTLDALFAERFRPAAGEERRELWVAHGNVIRSLVVRALKVEPMSWLEMSVGHASLTKIRIEADGTFKVIAVGDVGHLPPNLLTGATGDPDRSLAVPAEPAPR